MTVWGQSFYAPSSSASFPLFSSNHEEASPLSLGSIIGKTKRKSKLERDVSIIPYSEETKRILHGKQYYKKEASCTTMYGWLVHSFLYR